MIFEFSTIAAKEAFGVIMAHEGIPYQPAYGPSGPCAEVVKKYEKEAKRVLLEWRAAVQQIV